MSQLIKGNELPAALRKQVLSAYVYRLTTENGYPQHNPCGARVPAVTDAQWLAQHAFFVTKRGTLDRSRRYARPAYMADTETTTGSIAP